MDIKWIKGLREVSLLADEALANRILEAERLKTAELRLQMIERENRHMCLAPGCRNPVVGKLVFEHCERHLDTWEQRWFAEDIESPGLCITPKDESEHPDVTEAKEAIADLEREISKKIALRKQKALIEARELVEGDRRLRAERRAFLPEKLLRRITENHRAQQENVGWDES